MNKFLRVLILLSGICCWTDITRADPGPMSIWFTIPATPGDSKHWQQWALPVGNGKLAAMIYGGVGTEQIQFNEDTVWGGQPHNYANPNTTPARLATLQAECFNRTNTAKFLADATPYLMSSPIREAAYQPAGILNLTFPHSGMLNYLRSLDLNTATVNVHYDYSGVTYNRDIFASAPTNRTIVIRLTASTAGKISFSCNLTTLQTSTQNGPISTNELMMHARVSGVSDANYYATGLTNAIEYEARVRVLAEGGTVATNGTSVSVTNADAVTLLLAVASNFINYNDVSGNASSICSNNLAAAATNAYSQLRQAQLTDYQSLFQRVVLDLGGNSRTNLEIGYRKKQMSLDGGDPQLVTLDFQLGRYLMIAGSRPGSQALNLQGKWNDATAPGWDSKMTLNINEEMNYWGAEVCNLSECTLPLMDMIQDLSVTGSKVAQSNYFSSGWVAHHNTDLWRGAAPINGNDGIWPTGGAWLCQHVWWHYLYTGDTNWLATTGYPLMKGAAQFFQGYLVTHPIYGWKVTCPSYSPEHDEGVNANTIATSAVANIPSPTMDNELMRDLFSHVVAASQILGVDETFRTNIMTLQNQLPPEQIGSGGQLQEWLEDVDGNGYDAGHRHCSHLVGFFPGDEISTFYTPITAAAAKVSVDLRGYASSTITPWAGAWRLNFRTRLLDGDGAWANLVFLYGYNKVATNMIYADNNRQLDCMFGRLSGIAEMFLQSQNGDVILLPALPTVLTNGMVSGLCARGGFEVDDMSWTNGKLAGATILSKVGNICRLRSRWPIDVKIGSNYVAAPMILPGLYQFFTVAGSNYTIIPANIFETENLSATTSAGGTHQAVTNAAFSNVRGTQLNASAPGDFVTYAVNNVTVGNYRIQIAANAGTDCARFQLACASVGGVFTDIGAVQDTYSPTNIVYLLPLKFSTATNVISLWTNMVKEFDCGPWQAVSNGTYQIKFTVADKNAASSGYHLTLDYIKLVPVEQSMVTVPPNVTNVTNVRLQADVPGHTTNTISFTGLSNSQYILQFSTNLLTSPWFNLLTNSTDGNGLWSAIDPTATNEQRYYRISMP